MNKIEKLFLVDNLTGKEISEIVEESKSTIYLKLKEFKAVEIKNTLFYRLFSKIDIDENDCWNFKGALSKGYGRIKINDKLELTHRVSYEIFNGEIKENLFICHKCDNPSCVNSDHLFEGTHSDNMIDAYNKGRLVIPEGNRFESGHLPENSEMTLDEAKKVKKAIITRKNRKESLKDISKRFNIKYQTAKDISAGRSYINI